METLQLTPYLFNTTATPGKEQPVRAIEDNSSSGSRDERLESQELPEIHRNHLTPGNWHATSLSNVNRMMQVISTTIIMIRIVASQLKANRQGRNNVEDETVFALRVRSCDHWPDAVAHLSNSLRVLAIFPFVFFCPGDDAPTPAGDVVPLVFECAFEPWPSGTGAEYSGKLRKELAGPPARLEFMVYVGDLCRSYWR